MRPSPANACSFGQLFNGVAENLVALHPQEAGTAGRGHAAVDIEQAAVAAIRVEVGRKDPPVARGACALCRLQNQRACALRSPKRTQVERVLEIEDAAECLGADHQDALGLARQDQRMVLGSEDEARADRLHIEAASRSEGRFGLIMVATDGKVRSGSRWRR